MTSYKIGDIVECIVPRGIKDWEERHSGGSGWQIGRVFRVGRITGSHTNYNQEVLWPADDDGLGIFSHSVRPIKRYSRIKLFKQ